MDFQIKPVLVGGVQAEARDKEKFQAFEKGRVCAWWLYKSPRVPRKGSDHGGKRLEFFKRFGGRVHQEDAGSRVLADTFLE